MLPSLDSLIPQCDHILVRAGQKTLPSVRVIRFSLRAQPSVIRLVVARILGMH